MIGILGGGLAGIQAALELHKRNVEFVVLEAGDRIGGLIKTMQYKGWRYDYGVKALYSKNNHVMDYLRSLPVEYQEHKRHVKVYHGDGLHGNGVDIDYPFENGIGQLPHEDKVECLLGYLEAYYSGKSYVNFYEWIINRLGSGIARHFMIPYNQKIWNCPLEEISVSLVSGKIHPSPVEEIVRVALGEHIVGRQYQARFIYPKDGLSALIERMAAPIMDRVKLNFRVSRIEPIQHGFSVLSVGGESVVCSALVSTIPLPFLGELIPAWDCPRPQWAYNSTIFYTVLLNKHPANEYHWHFFASPRIPFYRLTYMHNFSDRFPPCIVSEMTDHGDNNPTERDTVDALVRLGLIQASWVECVRRDYAVCTYPIPTLKSEAEKHDVIRFYQSQRIYPLGRAGSWSYINVDQVIMQVWEKIPEIVAQL
jgi:protoporphyrinogen oxidase